MTAGPARRRANPVERLPMRLLRAVGEIQTEDVGAGGNQRVENGVGVARGPHRGDDFCVAHC